jgi:hypothetical protein
MSARLCLSPHSLKCCRHELNIYCHVHHQAPCPKLHHHHLRLWTRKDNHPLYQLLHNLLTCSFLHLVFKTCCQTTRTNISSLSLTDNKFGALLQKVKAHLLLRFLCTSTFLANSQFSPWSPPSKNTLPTQPSFPQPTPDKQPSSISHYYTSAAMQAMPLQPLTSPLVTWYTPSSPYSAKHF